MSAHGPARIQISSEGAPQFVQCLCGSVGGVSKWMVVRRTAEAIELSPSIDFREHFHTPNPTGLIPVADVVWDLQP